MHDLNVMAEPDWTLGWGLGIELWRRGERIFGGHTGGFPGFLSILVLLAARPPRRGRADELRQLAEAERDRPRARRGGARGARARARAVDAGGAAARRDRAAARTLVVGGRRVDLQLVLLLGLQAPPVLAPVVALSCIADALDAAQLAAIEGGVIVQMRRKRAAGLLLTGAVSLLKLR